MKKIIIDSSIWIGAFISKDKWHENGKKVLEWLQKEKSIRVIIPIGIIYEVIAGIINKPHGGFSKADQVLDLFMTDDRFEIFYNTEESFLEAQNIFKIYQGLSLVDATIVLLYENQNCTILYSTADEYKNINFITCLKFPV